MATANPVISMCTRKVQLGTAVIATAAATAVLPVVAPVVSQAAPLVSAAPVLTWGFDEVDSALIAMENDGGSAASASASAAAVSYPGPVELVQYLVTGIARGLELVIGTPVYAAVAFTGGLISTVGGALPGPLGDFFVNIGTTVDNVANTIAQALRVGPYATSTA